MRAIGITPTGSGSVSISGDMNSAEFQQLFAAKTEHSSDALAVPLQLAPFVESVTIAPSHLKFD